MELSRMGRVGGLGRCFGVKGVVCVGLSIRFLSLEEFEASVLNSLVP